MELWYNFKESNQLNTLINMQQLHPRSVWLFFISFLGRLLFLIIILGFSILGIVADISEGNNLKLSYVLNWALFIFLLWLILAYIWAKLSYHFYRYELKEEGFRKELGVIWKRYVTIPYDRIQNVDILRGVWARLLGLSDLQIQTAGMSGVAATEGRLPGLSREVAEELRTELIHRARQSGRGGGV